MAKTKGKKEKKKNVAEGKVYIQATFNNTIVTITDLMGNAISWASAGGLGFKGAKKSTPFAAQTTAEAAASKAMEQGLREVVVLVKGPGVGSEAAIRASARSRSRSSPGTASRSRSASTASRRPSGSGALTRFPGLTRSPRI